MRARRLADRLKPGRNPNKSLIVLLTIHALIRVGELCRFSKFQTPEFHAQRLWYSPHASIEIVKSREQN
jgi:hypothetical protein